MASAFEHEDLKAATRSGKRQPHEELMMGAYGK
jgi:hypothetical protein